MCMHISVNHSFQCICLLSHPGELEKKLLKQAVFMAQLLVWDFNYSHVKLLNAVEKQHARFLLPKAPTYSYFIMMIVCGITLSLFSISTSGKLKNIPRHGGNIFQPTTLNGSH